MSSIVTGKKILVVDDEEGIRDLISNELNYLGATCDLAPNGEEAFGLYRKNKYDIVISDVRMPKGSGVQFVKNVLSHEIPLCVFVLMTGFSETTPEEIYSLGVKVVIHKPFRVEELIASLEQVI